jgi:hypothetical protein
MNDSVLSWWEPVHLMFLAITSEMTAAQQQRIVKNLQGLAQLREKQGDIVASNFCHALAGDPFEEERRPTGTDPAGTNNKKPRPSFLRIAIDNSN